MAASLFSMIQLAILSFFHFVWIMFVEKKILFPFNAQSETKQFRWFIFKQIHPNSDLEPNIFIIASLFTAPSNSRQFSCYYCLCDKAVVGVLTHHRGIPMMQYIGKRFEDMTK